MARDQDAKLLELRATAGLARLLGETGQRGSARELLATIYAEFSEASIPSTSRRRRHCSTKGLDRALLVSPDLTRSRQTESINFAIGTFETLLTDPQNVWL
jgi:hypothetical protein